MSESTEQKTLAQQLQAVQLKPTGERVQQSTPPPKGEPLHSVIHIGERVEEEEEKNPIVKAWALPWVKVLAGILVIIVIFFIYRLLTKEGLIIIPQIHAGSRPRPVVFDAQLI